MRDRGRGRIDRRCDDDRLALGREVNVLRIDRAAFGLQQAERLVAEAPFEGRTVIGGNRKTCADAHDEELAGVVIAVDILVALGRTNLEHRALEGDDAELRGGGFGSNAGADTGGGRVCNRGRRLVAIAEHQGCAAADEGNDQDAEHGHGHRQLARLGRGRLGDLDFLGVFQDCRALGQVAVERRLLVHAEEASVGFDVAFGVDRRTEQARRHLLDGAQMADVHAGFAGDLFQRETGVFAGGADFVADALVDGGSCELGVSVGHDTQMRGRAAGAGLSFVLYRWVLDRGVLEKRRQMGS